MNRLVIAAALMVVFAGPAAAGLFRVGDLGAMPSRQACLMAARTMLESYLDAYGGESVAGDAENPESWEVYAWRLRPGENDIVITCPVVNGQVNAFFTLHTASDDASANADTVVERVRELWGHHH